MVLSAAIISASGDFYQVRSCEEVSFMYGGSAPPQNVPQCYAQNGTAQGHITVKANLNGTGPEQIGASLSEGFSLGVSLILGGFAQTLLNLANYLRRCGLLSSYMPLALRFTSI